MRKVRVSFAFEWPMTNPLTWNVMLIFFNLNRKVNIMPRACDNGTFVVEVDINAGLKWWLREARGFHINIWWCIGFNYSSVGVILLRRDILEDPVVVFIVSCLDSAVIKLGPTGHVVWLKFGGRVRIIFASWVNFNRAIISKRQLSVDDGLQIQKNQHIKHDFLSELFSNEDTKKVGRLLRHSWHVFHLYFLGGFETRIRKSKYSVRYRHARPEFWYLFCLLFSLH